MMLRPVANSFICCGCRRSIVRAAAAPALRAGSAAVAQPRLSPQRQIARLLSSTLPHQPTSAIEHQDTKEVETDKKLAEDATQDSKQPWFLDVEPPRHPPSLHKPTLPTTPDGAPDLLSPMIKYVYEDMGLDDLSLLDLRELDPPAALGPNLIMLFGTARSERHLHISSGRFIRWLRRNYKVDARADGLIGPGELKTKLRRLRKKAKLMGTNTMIVPGGDNGISTGWVCVNFSISTALDGEAENFDESGRFSGFNSTPLGTTIVVQCLTEPRRNELNLEPLWQGMLRRSLEKSFKIKGEPVPDQAKLETMVSSRLQLPDNPAAAQWQKLERASQISQQRRYFSVSARQLRQGNVEKQPDSEAPSEKTDADLDGLVKHIDELQIGGTPLSEDVIKQLVRAVLQIPHGSSEDAQLRLNTVDQLLLTAQERGMKVYSKEMLVMLIEAAVSSPSYGPRIERTQKNLEMLLLELYKPLEESEAIRLLKAYAQVQQWDRFWDTFRTAPRFQVARSPAIYEFVYQTIGATKNAQLCTEALRWVYPEMLKENPPIYATGSLYSALKQCILVADPAAEELLHNPPAVESLDIVTRRRLQHREFVRVLKEVEELRQHLISTHVQEERAHTLGRLSAQED